MIRCYSNGRAWNHNRALIALGTESAKRVSLVGHDLTPCPRASARRWKRQFWLLCEYTDGSEHHRGTSPSPFPLSALSSHANLLTIQDVLCHTIAPNFVFQRETFFNKTETLGAVDGELRVHLLTDGFTSNAHSV